MSNQHVNVGDTIWTPRFLNVQIEAVFSNEQAMLDAGYTEPTHFKPASFTIRGKSLGMNRMTFAAAYISEHKSLHSYVVLYRMDVVRNTEIFTGTDINDEEAIYDDSLWELDESAEVFIGIYQGENEREVRERAAAEKVTIVENLRAIEIP